MKAVVLESYGDPDVLTLREVPDPVPGPEELLVAVEATALNRADLLQRRGFYPGPHMDHEIPGMEFAGRVAALGARVTGWEVGEPLMGIVGGGAYATALTVHHRQAMKVPTTLADAVGDAAAIPEVFLTAFDALVVQGGLTAGRWALVHAGGSGVGTAAIQIARAVGAHVVTTASAGKLAACRELGAEVAVDYTSDDFVAACAEATGGRGVDAVLDVIGGDYLDRNVDALRIGGRIVQVGVMAGGGAAFPLGKLLPKRAAVIGTVLRARPLEEKIALTQRFAAEQLPLFAEGKLRPVIDSRYPLAEVAAAHRHMEANANVGKILLTCR